jgi:hypothetical protein
MDLKVPYSEKDAAKALGARWDAKRKKWFVPPGEDVNKFAKWLDPEFAKWDKLADGWKDATAQPGRVKQKRTERVRRKHAAGSFSGEPVESNPCPHCIKIPPWEPQCGECTERFAGRVSAHGDLGELPAFYGAV